MFGTVMVYCWKCGAENDTGAVSCKSCGAMLQRTSERGYRAQYEHHYDWGRGIHLGGVLFGLIVMLVGLIWLSEGQIEWLRWSRIWPLLIVLVGVFVIANAILKR